MYMHSMETTRVNEQREELEQWQRSYSCVGETLRQLLHAGWNVHLHTLQQTHTHSPAIPSQPMRSRQDVCVTEEGMMEQVLVQGDDEVTGGVIGAHHAPHTHDEGTRLGTVPVNTPITVSRQCSTDINTFTGNMATELHATGVNMLNGEELEQCLLEMLNDVDLRTGYNITDDSEERHEERRGCSLNANSRDNENTSRLLCMGHDVVVQEDKEEDMDIDASDISIPLDQDIITEQSPRYHQSMDVESPCDNVTSSQEEPDSEPNRVPPPIPSTQVPNLQSHPLGHLLSHVPSHAAQATPSLAPFVDLTQMFTQLLTSFYFEVFLWMYGNVMHHPRSAHIRTRLMYLGQITGQPLEDITRNVMLGYFHGFHQGRTSVFREICSVLRSVNHGAGGVTVDASQSRWLRELSVQMGVHLNSRQMLRSFSAVVTDLVNNQQQAQANNHPPPQNLIWLATIRRNRLVILI